MRLFWSLEPADMNMFAINLRLGSPLVFRGFIEINASKPAFSILLPVATIYAMRYVPKIDYPVVIFDAIDMVSILGRPSSIYIKPSQAMGFYGLMPNFYDPVAIASDMTGQVSYMDTLSRPFAPNKHTSIRVVIKDVFDFFLSRLHLIP